MLKTGPHLAATCLASEASTLADLFARRVTRSGDVAAYFVKEHGKWRPTSWRQFDDAASRIAHGLVERGINPGDRVAILGPTEASWVNQDIGAQMAGAISLGIYPKQSVEQVRYILEHGEARLIFVADETELGTVLEAARDCERLEHIVPWTQDVYEAHRERDPRIAAPGDFLRTPLTADTKAERRAARASEDTAIFVYTSGTTGPPKCAMISHANIMSVLRHQTSLGPLYEDDISLSFLPMAHVAERVLAFYGRISAGFATAYASSISAVLDELREVRPTVFGSVPRIFEKAYARIDSELARKPPIVRKLFAWAVKIGKRRLEYSLEGRSAPPLLELQFRLADRLVFRRIRDAFGGRVRQFITGAAPTPMGVLEFFWSAGLPIYEVYGMTEATVVTHGNAPGHTRLGTVGRALGSVEHRIADDGEILIRGPLVFEGYFKDPEATASTIVDGWLHTGDIGRIDGDGYLRITDRKKHLIITAGGKNLTPANIENAIKSADALIGHLHAHGDQRPYITALIVPSPIETLEFGLARGLVTEASLKARTRELMDNPSGRTAALAEAMTPVTAHPEFRDRMRKAVRRGNESLSKVERVKRFAILDRDFSQEDGELTPTMKVRRKEVEQSYAETFARIYDDDSFGIAP